MAGFDIYIDASELNKLTDFMASKLTIENFDRLMTRTMYEVGRRAKKPIVDAVRTEYEVKANWVRRGIQTPRVGGGGGDVFCKIPLKGPKGHVGGTFHASGGARGWNSLHRKYSVKTKIVKGKVGTLPGQMGSYGGQPPFRNLASSSIAFTRKGKERLPIASIPAIAKRCFSPPEKLRPPCSTGSSSPKGFLRTKSAACSLPSSPAITHNSSPKTAFFLVLDLLNSSRIKTVPVKVAEETSSSLADDVSITINCDFKSTFVCPARPESTKSFTITATFLSSGIFVKNGFHISLRIKNS